jgi:hypothetical protein
MTKNLVVVSIAIAITVTLYFLIGPTFPCCSRVDYDCKKYAQTITLLQRASSDYLHKHLDINKADALRGYVDAWGNEIAFRRRGDAVTFYAIGRDPASPSKQIDLDQKSKAEYCSSES